VKTPVSRKFIGSGPGSVATGSVATTDTVVTVEVCAKAVVVRISPKKKPKTLFFIKMPIPEDVRRLLWVSDLYVKGG
jgi:hypothetical protein